MGTTGWLVTLLACFAAAQLGSAASRDESQFRKPVDCRNKQNGNFVWGCSQFYSICDNGNEVEMQCYSDLVLNPKNNFCDRRANVAACKDPTATRNTLYKSKDPFTCDRKRDGQYLKDDCSEEYILCTHGNLQIQRCPPGTKYDGKEGVCQWAADIAACNPDLASSSSDEDDGTIVERGPSHPSSQRQSQPQGPPKPQGPRQQQGQSHAQSQGARQPQGSTQSQVSPQGNPRPGPQQPVPPVHRRRIGAQIQYPAFQQPPQVPSVDPAPPAPVPQQYAGAPAPQQYGQNWPYQPPAQDPAPIPTDPPATTRRPIGFDCSQRVDGYYPGKPCTKDYFACAAGQAFEFQCPGELVFDALIQGCDYPSECGQPRTTTTPAPTTRRQVNFDCTSRPDGYYTTNGRQCTNDYYHCLAGTAFGLTCPGSTVFDALVQACDWPELCGQPRTTPLPTTPPPTVVTRPVNFDCSQRTDGIYVEQPCQDHYYSCANGIAHQFNCAPGTLFDPNSQACQYAENCGQTPATDPPTPPPADAPAPSLPAYVDSHGGGYYFQPQGYQQPQQSYGQAQTGFPQSPASGPQFPPLVPVAPLSGGVVLPSGPVASDAQPSTVAPVPQTTFDCSGQPDGFYEQGQCQQNYVRCANGLAFAQQCPEGLVFRIDICEFPADCANPTQPTPAFPAATTPSPINSSGVITTQPSDARCASLSNGNHPVADCSQQYSSCWGGQGVRATCPGSLFYNPDNNFCDFRRNVVGCGSPSGSAVVPSGPVASDSGAQFVPPVGTTPAPPTQPPSTFCLDNRKSTGFFGEACNSYFYSCDASGGTTRFLCPVGLFFDSDEGFCNHRELVVACGGIKPSTPAPTTPPPGVALDTGVGIGQPSATQTTSQFDCGTKAPGYYSNGCSSTYFSCAGGISIALTCPAGLLFSESTQRCDYRNSVPECGGNAETTPSPITPSSVVQSQPAFPPAPQPPQPQQPLVPQPPLQQIPSAFPPAPQPQQPSLPPQQPQPVQPIAPHQPSFPPQQPQTRPAFPPAPQQSQPPQFVPAPPQQSLPIVSQPQYSIQPQGPVRQRPGSKTCNGRLNGIYGRPCSRFYYVCNYERKYEFICPAAQVYSPNAGKCVPQDQTPACNMSSPYAVVSPAPILSRRRHRHH